MGRGRGLFLDRRDLPGPKVSRDELEAAIAGVGGASELISARVRDTKGGIEAGLELGIADGLSHGGFILPEKKFPLNQVDFSAETGRVVINGEVRAQGAASQMMNGAPLDAVLRSPASCRSMAAICARRGGGHRFDVGVAAGESRRPRRNHLFILWLAGLHVAVT